MSCLWLVGMFVCLFVCLFVEKQFCSSDRGGELESQLPCGNPHVPACNPGPNWLGDVGQ